MMDDLSFLHTFDGVTRLFPLPKVVLFPLVTLPLHIFEPRYRQMTADALAGDRLITMILLKPGYEAQYLNQLWQTGVAPWKVWADKKPAKASPGMLKATK